MGCCTRRHFLLTICAFQLITIIERQVFDFLGFMWAPILANFFHIIFVIFGFFGCYQFRAKYLVTYAIWNVFWLGWNAFLVCFYLSVGILDKNSVFLNFGSVSWFESNGYGCQPVFSTNFTVELPVWPIRPERVDNCLLDYEYVEIAHSGVQLALSLLALLGAILMSKTFYDDDDRFDFVGGNSKSPQHTIVHPQYVSYTSIPSAAGGGHNALFSPAKRTNTLSSLNTNNTNPRPEPAPSSADCYGFAAPTAPTASSASFNSLNKTSSYTNANCINLYPPSSAAKFHNSPLYESGTPQSTFGPSKPSGGTPDQQSARYNIRYAAVPLDEHKPTNGPADALRELTPLSYIEEFQRQCPDTQRAQPHDDESIQNYEMPKSYAYVATRSPLRTRAAFARTSQAAQMGNSRNFVDQIREPPPGYRPVQRMGSIPRTKSHDRILQRQRQQSNGASQMPQQPHVPFAGSAVDGERAQHVAPTRRMRPRSYCSNIVSDSFMHA